MADGRPAGAGRGAVSSGEAAGTPEEVDAATRRRRRAEVFGEVLPGSTSDDRDLPGAGDDGGGEPAADRWLRSNVPPHHG